MSFPHSNQQGMHGHGHNVPQVSNKPQQQQVQN